MILLHKKNPFLTKDSGNVEVFKIKYYNDNCNKWGGIVAYKLDGAKFETIEELVEALYPIYSDKMSVEEFKKFVEENASKS